MKKLISVALVALTLTSITTSHAAPGLRNQTTNNPTLAILDTALDTSLPIFKDRVVHEVCILDWNTCPNGKNFMEGPGSSVIPLSVMSKPEFTHGTQMASAALLSNPDLKIVFIRIIGANGNGHRQISGESTVINALSWVKNNQSRFNIQAVTMAQSHHNLAPALGDYCPTKNVVAPLISQLNALNVAVFLPAGNVRDYNRLSWPACINESISIGATDQLNAIAIYSNYDKNNLDFYANGSLRVFLPGGQMANAAGTSISIQVAAAQWIAIKTLKPNLTYQQTYDLIKSTAIEVKNSKITGGKLINLLGASNG